MERKAIDLRIGSTYISQSAKMMDLFMVIFFLRKTKKKSFQNNWSERHLTQVGMPPSTSTEFKWPHQWTTEQLKGALHNFVGVLLHPDRG